MDKIFSAYGRTDWPIESVKAAVGPGWHKIIDDLVADLFKLEWNGELAQIKEKFGGLRFYIGAANDAVHNRIQQAEDLSFETCESCGTTEDVTTSANGGYWIKTHCKECRSSEKKTS